MQSTHRSMQAIQINTSTPSKVLCQDLQFPYREPISCCTVIIPRHATTSTTTILVVRQVHNNLCRLRLSQTILIIITHTHPFNGPFSGTTQISQYQKGKTNLDFTEARESERQWHQLGHMQVCTSLQTDNQWRIAKNGGGYTQRGVTKGLKLPCLFMISEVSIRCQKTPEVGVRRIPAYTPQYTTADNHASTPLLGFYRPDALPGAQPTAS